MLTLNEILAQLHVCSEARQWAATQPDARTAWCNCPRGDWLLRGAVMLGIEHKTIIAAACDCAELALPYVAKGEDRPQKTVDIIRAWLVGEATLDEVRTAARAADAAWAAWAAETPAAARAARAAAAAARAAWAAEAATAAPASAAAAAWIVATARADARSGTLKQCADIVRSRITWEHIAEAVNQKCLTH